MNPSSFARARRFLAPVLAPAFLLATAAVGAVVVAACSEDPSEGAKVDPVTPPPSTVDPSDLGPDAAIDASNPDATAVGDDAGDAGDGGKGTPQPTCANPVSAPGAATGEGGVFDVDVTVHTGRGPKGRPAPVPTDRRLYGMNIADWEPGNYTPTPKPAFATYLSALKPGVLRWPAGHRSQEYNWARGGTGQTGDWTLGMAQVDAFIALAKQMGAEPLIAINVKRGTTAAAADLLHYMNVEKGYGVKYLQIGNEPDLTDDMTASPAVYVDQLIRFVDALKAVDPAVKIIGPEMLTGAHIGGIQGTVDWMTPILAQTANRIDGISWHYYPLDSGQKNPSSSAIMTVPHLFQESAPDWRPASLAYVDEVMPALDLLRKTHAPKAEVWITEIAEDPGPLAGVGISDTLAGALWVGDVLGRYGEYGPGAVLRWLFKGSSIHAYGLLDSADVPRPAYGAYWLYARHFGDRFVDTTSSSITSVAAHASLRTDGAVSVVLVNKTTSPRRVGVTLDGFAACAGEASTLSGASYDSKTFTINGAALGETAARDGIPPVTLTADGLLDMTLPAMSMRTVVYRP